MKFRYLIYALFCSIFGCAAAHAQYPNCSDIRDEYRGYGTTSKAGCYGTFTTWSFPAHYTGTYHFDWQCITIYPLSQTTYAMGSVAPAEIGSCYLKLVGGIQDCPPTYTLHKTRSATTPSAMELFWQMYLGKTYPVSGCYQQGEKGSHESGDCNAVSCVINPNNCPIIIDLDGLGFNRMTDPDHGVLFNFGGTMYQVSWPEKGAMLGWLALPGPDGLVHDASQLFGNYSPQLPSDFPNGFAALAIYDTNHDNQINRKDPVWESLRVWVDLNHDGKSTPNEMFTLEQAGITSIGLTYSVADAYTDSVGDQFRFDGVITTVAGDRAEKRIWDVFLATDCDKKK